MVIRRGKRLWRACDAIARRVDAGSLQVLPTLANAVRFAFVPILPASAVSAAIFIVVASNVVAQVAFQAVSIIQARAGLVKKRAAIHV